ELDAHIVDRLEMKVDGVPGSDAVQLFGREPCAPERGCRRVAQRVDVRPILRDDGYLDESCREQFREAPECGALVTEEQPPQLVRCRLSHPSNPVEEVKISRRQVQAT